jgi:predicted methyltransferase
MKTRTALFAAATAALLAASSAAVLAAAVPAYITAAVNDAGRPQAQKDLDAVRHPAEMLAATGVKPGMKVVEFVPGGGYNTRLLSKVVGPMGKVYSIELSSFPDRMKDAIKPVTGDAAYSNVVVSVQDATKLSVPEPVDVVWVSENYHDFKNMGPFQTDTNAMDKAVLAALKPGGLFVINDYEAQAGSGTRDTQTLHRIDPAVIKSEVTAAGFQFVSESNVLKNADDKLTDRSHQTASQVMYVFRKPG